MGWWCLGGTAWKVERGPPLTAPGLPAATCPPAVPAPRETPGTPQATENTQSSRAATCWFILGQCFQADWGGSVPYTFWHTQRGWVWGFAFVPGAQLWEVGVAETSARVGQTVLVPSAGGAAQGMGAVGQWVLRWQWGGMAPNWQLPVQPPQPGLGCAWKRWMRWSEQDGCPTPCRPLRAGCGVGLTLQWGNTRTAAVLQAALLAGWTVLVLQA